MGELTGNRKIHRDLKRLVRSVQLIQISFCGVEHHYYFGRCWESFILVFLEGGLSWKCYWVISRVR
ncbi:hypothetical protein ACSBR1_029641 [Camellia fascicularis]